MQLQLLLYNALLNHLIYGGDSALNRSAFNSAIKAKQSRIFLLV